MLILGGDIATCSGLCWLDTAKPPKEWRVLAAISEGDFREDESADIGRYVYDQVIANRPDFAALEMPRRDMEIHDKKGRDPETGQPINKTTINPNAVKLTGHAAAVCTGLDIAGVPWGLIAAGTWRSAYYGKGWTPADNDWKQAAVDRAALQGIVPPVGMTKKAWKDACEAVGIASAWPRCTLIPKRHQHAFMSLRLGGRHINHGVTAA